MVKAVGGCVERPCVSNIRMLECSPVQLLCVHCRKLKAAAEDVLSSPWDTLYSCRIVRTSRGKGFGLLVGSYGLGWHLWPASEGGSRCSVRDCEQHPQAFKLHNLLLRMCSTRGARVPCTCMLCMSRGPNGCCCDEGLTLLHVRAPCYVCCCPVIDATESSDSVRDECVLWSMSRPEQSELVAALNEAARAADAGKPGGLSGLLEQWQKRPK